MKENIDQHVAETFGPLEQDPNGLSQHAPGAKLDSGKNRLGLVFCGFSRALQAVGEVGTFGAKKYTDHGWARVPDGIERYTDAMLRHMMKEAEGEWLDSDSGLTHAAAVAWNSLARLELLLRSYEAVDELTTQAQELKMGYE